jgi:hypothetical protein
MKQSVANKNWKKKKIAKKMKKCIAWMLFIKMDKT